MAPLKVRFKLYHWVKSYLNILLFFFLIASGDYNLWNGRMDLQRCQHKDAYIKTLISIDHFPMTRVRGRLITTPWIVIGGQHTLQMYYVLWSKPDHHTHFFMLLHLGIAIHESPALFVEQRGSFHKGLLHYTEHSRHCPTKLASQTLKCYCHSHGSLLWVPLSWHDWQESLMQWSTHQNMHRLCIQKRKGDFQQAVFWRGKVAWGCSKQQLKVISLLHEQGLPFTCDYS